MLCALAKIYYTPVNGRVCVRTHAWNWITQFASQLRFSQRESMRFAIAVSVRRAVVMSVRSGKVYSRCVTRFGVTRERERANLPRGIQIASFDTEFRKDRVI